MKRIVCLFLTVLLLCNSITPVNAKNIVSHVEEIILCETEYLDNGDMIVTTISYCPDNYCATTMANYQTKTATKRKLYKNAEGDVLWSVAVTGTFRYEYGVSSECFAATGSSELISSAWSLGDVSSRKSGNTAIASVSGTRYYLFVPLETVELSVALSCSNTGVLS